MSATRDYIDYLNDSIEMAPAGSEEELQAAQTIEALMAQHGLDTQIQEFETSSAGDLGRMVILILMFVGIVLAGILDTVVSWVGIAVVVVAFALTMLARAGYDLLGMIAPRAASQNVIGVHTATGPLVQKGNRKIVVIAHYDTPRVNFMYKGQMGHWLPLFSRLSWYLICIVLALALFQAISVIPTPVRHVVWILGVASAIPLLLLGVSAVYERFAPCTVGANDNKASVAAMLGVLEQVRPGSDAALEWADGHRSELEAGASRSQQSAVSDPRVRDDFDESEAVDAGEPEDAYEDLDGFVDEEGVQDNQADEGDRDWYDEMTEPDEDAPEDGRTDEGESDEGFDESYDQYDADEEPFDEPVGQDEYDASEDEYDEDAYDGPDDVWSEEGWVSEDEDFEDGAGGGFSLGSLFKGVKLPFGHKDDFEAEPAFDDEPLDMPELGTRADLAPSFDDMMGTEEEADAASVDEQEAAERVVKRTEVEAEVGEVSDSVMSLPVIGPDGEVIVTETEQIEEPEDLYGEDPDGLEVPMTARHGLDTLERLQLLPDTCEVVYRDLSTREEVLSRREAEATLTDGGPFDEEDYDDFKREYDEEPREMAGRFRSMGERMADRIKNFFGGLRVRMGGQMDQTDEFEPLTDEDYLLDDDFSEAGWIDDMQPKDRKKPESVRDLQASAASAHGMYVPDDTSYAEEYDEGGDVADEIEDELDSEDEVFQEDEPALDDVQEDEPLEDELSESDIVPEPEDEPVGVDEPEVEAAVEDADELVEAVVEEDEPVDAAEPVDEEEPEVAEAVADEDEEDESADDTSRVIEGLRGLRFSEEKDVDDEELASKDITGLSTISNDDVADWGRVHDGQGVGTIRPASVDDPSWGTSSFKPSVAGVTKRANLRDLPDPSASKRVPSGTSSTQTSGGTRKDRLSKLPSPMDDVVDEREENQRESQSNAVSVVDERSAAARRRDRKASAHKANAKSSSRRGFFRREEEPQEESLSDWLGVSDDYDAKKDGRAIGSWERFDDDSSWKGGATFRSGLRDVDDEEILDDPFGTEELDQIDEYKGTVEDADVPAAMDESEQETPEDVELIEVENQEELREAILRMGDELVCHDIYFVALGASQLDHAGMRAFLDEYRMKVRGSFVINLDSVGAGNLTLITREGPNAKRKSDRRLGRLITKVADDLHIRLGHMDYVWSDTDGTYAVNKALRVASIMGLSEDYLPALSHTTNDVPRNMFPAQVVDVCHIVTELIRRS